MKTQTTLAYAAGIFDGEGYVDIYTASKPKMSKNTSLMLRVIISQKDGLIMNWLKENFGGYVLLSRKGSYHIYRWDIRSKAAAQFLNEILPYVKIKRTQVEIALRFESLKGNYWKTLKGSQGFRVLTETEVKERMELKDKLKQLKKVYIPYNKI